jgi:peptidoglycan/LPS O-acetylase OafA/YrhL
MTPTAPFRADINALRALAVGIVVLYHFKFPGFKGGFLGVDIFFVISGYLMTKIIVGDMLKGSFRYGSFVAMRMARIWPALIGLVLALLLLGAALLPPSDYADLWRQSWAAVLFYSNVFFSEGVGYFNFGPDERWLLHTWSLSVEWQFYLVYPLLLMAVQRLGGAGRADAAVLARRCLWTIGAVAAASLAYGIWATRAEQVAAFFSLFTRIWEMLCGGVVYLCAPRLQAVATATRNRVQALAFASLLVTALVAGLNGWEHQWPGAWAILPVLLTALALACGEGTTGVVRRVIDHRLIQCLGLWSYSIYLWHWPIVVALNFAEMQPTLAPFMKYLKIGGMLASVLLGYLSYGWIEQRFRWRKQHPARQRGAVAAAGGVALAAVSAFAVVHSEGWLSRAGAEQALYRAYAEQKAMPLIPVACQNSRVGKADLQVCSLHEAQDGPRILVYGDSHAQHLYAWFGANTRARVDFLTSSGCPPVPGYNRRGPRIHCDEYMEKAIRRAQSPHYDTVVVAGNWSGVMNLCRVERGACTADDGPAAEKARALASANLAAWQALARQGKQVIVVDQSPMSRFNVLTTAMRRRFLGLPPVTTFDDIQAAPNPGREHLDQIFQRVEPHERIVRVSLRPELCTGADCRIFDDPAGLPIMVDRSHFAPWWIEQNGKALQRYIGAGGVVVAGDAVR